MAETFESLLKTFRDVTHSKLKQNKDTAPVKLLVRTVKSLETVLGALDKFLKSKNIDVGKAYEKSKEKTKSLAESGKKLFEETKEKGLRATLTGKALDVKSKLGNIFAGDKEKENGPPEAKTSVFEKVKALATNVAKGKKTTITATIDSDDASLINVKMPNGEEYVLTPDRYKQLKTLYRFIPTVELIENLDEPVANQPAEKTASTTETAETTEKLADGKKEKKTGKLKSTLTNLKDKLKSKLSGGGAAPLEEKKSWLDRVKERTAKRKNEVEEEKKSVLARGAKKAGGGWLGKILSGVMSLGGMIVGGLTKSINFLGGFLLKGFSKALFRLIPGLSGGIAKTLQSLVGRGLLAAGKGALSLAGTAARAALPMAGQALGLAARGAAMIATGPIGWAVAIGTAAYAGYKLYKYLTRNNVASDVYGKLTRLRLLMYGLNDVNKEYYSKIFDLEMIMKDYVKFTNYQVQITKLDSKAIEKILELFGISREEKEKYAVLNTWFMKRFIPAYKAFMTALYSVNSNIYLDDLDKLKPGDLMNFISKFQIPTIIYNVTQAPTGDKTDVLVKKEDVDALYTNICNEVKAKAPKEKTPEEKAREENARAAAQQKQQAAAATKKETAPAKQEPLKKETPVPKGGEDKASAPDSEGEGKPTIKEEVAKTEEKASGKLNAASGALTPGGMSLEGITTKLDKSKIYNLDPNVRELFTGMAKEYHALTGKSIPVNEAFRSYEDQAELYKKMPDKAAKPGNSTHEAGLAIDINGNVSRELDKLGLLRKYGFSTSVGTEDWHLEPIGVSVNPTLAKKDENFRTKAVLSSPGKGGGGYGFLASGLKKKRNIEHQLSIYNSASDNPIDVEKVAEKTATKEGGSPTGAVLAKTETKGDSFDQSMAKSGDSFDKSLASAGAGVDQKVTPKIGDSFDQALSGNLKGGTTTIKTTTTGGGSKTTYAAEGEGEAKPPTIIPSQTKTMVSGPFKKDGGPSLDVNNPKINGNMDIAKFAELPTETAIRQAAKMSGMDENTMFNFAKIESSLNPNAKAKTSSAGGLFQITDPTWDELMKKHAAKYNIPPNADKFNPFYNSLLAAEYSKDNLKRLNGWDKAGMEEPAALYLGHHFGVSGANKILNKANQNEEAPIQEAVSEASYKANRQELGGKTVGDYIDYLGQKIAKVAGTIFKPKEYAGKKKETDNSPPPTPTSDAVAATPAATPAANTSKMATTSAPKDSAVKIASNSIAASMPPMPAAPAPMAPPSLPVRTVKASISNSNYSSSMMNNMNMPKDSMVQDSFKQMFNSGKMEGILTEQLTELRTMVTVLRSIDGKVGTGQPQAPAAKAAVPPVDRSIPNSSINLSRRSIQA